MHLIEITLNSSVLCRIPGPLSPSHTLSRSFSAWISLQCRPVTSAGCKLLGWFYCPAAIRGVKPTTRSYTAHTSIHSIFNSHSKKSSKLLLDCSSKENPRWKVGQEWLHLSSLLHLWWCHYWAISTLKYYSRPSHHIRCQAKSFFTLSVLDLFLWYIRSMPVLHSCNSEYKLSLSLSQPSLYF